MNSVLVLGGTGQIGVFLLPALVDAGWQVVAPTRQVRSEWRPAAGRNRLLWIPAASGAKGRSGPGAMETVNAIVSAGPLELAAPWLDRCPEARRVVCFSSSSVAVKSDSPDPVERRTVDTLRRGEERLARACERTGALLTVLRPTLIYGCGRDRNLTRIVAFARRWRFVPVAGAAAGLRQPVHAADLAALAVRLLQEPSPPDVAYAPGGETVSYRQMVERAVAAAGCEPRLLPLPTALLALALGLAGRWRDGADTAAPMAERQNRDLTFEAAIWARCGLRPRPFRPTPQDFEVPPGMAELQPG